MLINLFFLHIWEGSPPGDKIPKERICGQGLTSSDLRVEVSGEIFMMEKTQGAT